MSGDSPHGARHALDQIGVHAQTIVDGRVEPYTAGWEIWGLAMAGIDGSTVDIDHCHGLWLIWGALTDWVELRPADESAAEAAMLRVATDWLAARYDERQWRALLDHWIYDELGYRRPD